METMVKRRKGLRLTIIALFGAMLVLTTTVAMVFWAGTIGDAREYLSTGNQVTIGEGNDLTTTIGLDENDTGGVLIPMNIEPNSNPYAPNYGYEVHFVDFTFEVDWLPTQITIDDGLDAALYGQEGRLYVEVPEFNLDGINRRTMAGRNWTGTAFEPTDTLFEILVDGTLVAPGDDIFVGTIYAMDEDSTEVVIRVRMNQPISAAEYNLVRTRVAEMTVRFDVFAPVVPLSW